MSPGARDKFGRPHIKNVQVEAGPRVPKNPSLNSILAPPRPSSSDSLTAPYRAPFIAPERPEPCWNWAYHRYTSNKAIHCSTSPRRHTFYTCRFFSPLPLLLLLLLLSCIKTCPSKGFPCFHHFTIDSLPLHWPVLALRRIPSLPPSRSYNRDRNPAHHAADDDIIMPGSSRMPISLRGSGGLKPGRSSAALSLGLVNLDL